MPIGLDAADPIVPAIAWAARALTFFNVMVLLWLGLTVLLNAERRRLGTWLTGGGLLLGGLCSIARTAAQASQPLDAVGPPDIWWRMSWLPFAGAAYLWAVVLMWYASHLRTWAEWRSLTGLSLLGVGAFALLVTAHPPEAPVSRFRLPFAQPALPIASMPGDGYLALAAYLTFSALCVLQGLRALYHPQHPDRFMGELASRRARPWLTAMSLATLGLSLIVGLGVTGSPVLTPWALVDLLGALLLAAQVVLLGQAIVSYEVFTGKTLPRRGLVRYWRNALILAAGFGVLLAVSLGLPLDQSYRLTLALVVVAVFYALLSWRSFAERERSLEQLRPFIASERLVEHLLAPGGLTPQSGDLTPQPPLPRGEGELRISGSRLSAPERGAGGAVGIEGPHGGMWRSPEPFHAVCRELLGARVGYLCPVGPLASLIGEPVAAPAEATPPAPGALATLTARIDSARQLCLPVDPATHGGAAWAVPLWGERGLIGLLLLGEKLDGSLYTQEEIEIARAAGERLIDARAASELARRLLLLQRRRLAEDHLLDGRVRRALHDDVLPLLHTALLALASQAPANAPASDDASPAALLTDAHRQIAGLLAELPPALSLDVARAGLLGALRRVTADLETELDGVEWSVDAAGERALAELPPLSADVLFGAAREAIRNAVRHGRASDPSRPLHLWIVVVLDAHDEVVIRIQDDGAGLAARPETRGNGQGLLLHGTLLTVVGGALTTESAPGQGTRVTLRVPR